MKIMENKEVRVIRNSKIKSVPVIELVVGDVLFLEGGDIVPVDGILFKAYDIICDESHAKKERTNTFTYKRVPYKYIEEENADPFIIKGSKIEEGRGEIIVCAVGSNATQHGNVAESELDMNYLARETKLTKKMAVIANKLTKTSFLAIIIYFCSLSFYFMIELMGKTSKYSLISLYNFLNNLLSTIGILVVVIPEGLPLSVSTALVYTLIKLKDNGNLVRYFSSN